MNTLIPPPLSEMSPTAQHYLSTASASSDPVPGRPMTTPLQAPRNVLQLLGYFDNTFPTAHGYVDPARIDGEGAWRDRFLGFGEGVPWTRETHTPGLPDSLLGRNSYMMSTINASVIGSGDFYAGELLPYSDAGNIHVAWDVLRMNEQLAHRSPEEGVTRLLTWEKHTRTQNAVRRGLAMQLESDTFHTPEGARHFMMELDGLIRAVRATINLDVMTALMDCAQQRDAREEGAKRYRGVAGLTRVAVREIDSYALLQSRAHGLEILIAEAREQMSRRGASPDTVVLPPGAVAFLSQRPEYQGAFSAYSRQVGAQVYGCKVYEAEYVCVGDRASTTAGERDMRCPLVRPTDVGERYHVTDGGAVSLSVLNACDTALTLYSEIQDRWIDVPMRKLLRYGNNRFGGARDGAVHLHLEADSTLAELAVWASEWWDKLCGTLMPRDGRMLLRPDWLLWRDWTVKSSFPKSYKTVLTMWHLSQAQFPSLFTPRSLAITRLMQNDMFYETIEFGTNPDGESFLAGQTEQYRASNFDGMLWFAVAQTMPVAGDFTNSASAVPYDRVLVEQGSVDVWRTDDTSAKILSLKITSAYWHYLNAQYKGRLPSSGTVGALYNDCVGNANAARTASKHGCGAGIVDAHHFQISLLMWHFCHMYEEHCVQSGYTGSLRNGTLSTLRNFVHVLFRQSQAEDRAQQGETDIKRDALKRALKRVERVDRLENLDAQWHVWLNEARSVVLPESNDDGRMGELLHEFEQLCNRHSLDATRYVYPLPNVWAALLDAVGTCKIAGSDAQTLVRVSSALERADARFAERVACCVGGRGVVDVGKDHVKCPTYAEMPASSKRRRGRGGDDDDDDDDDDKTVEEDAANSAVATRIEDVTYMAALFAVYACDLLSASVGAGAAQMPLAAYVPDAVLDTYAQEWHRVYHLTEASRLSIFDDAYLQKSLGNAKWQQRLHGCAMALSLMSDGIFAVLGAADLDCHTTSATWRDNNLTERASMAFGPGSRVTAALAVPPTSLALLLFVSRAYDDLAHRNEACEYPDITGDVEELIAPPIEDPAASERKRQRSSATETEEMGGGAYSFTAVSPLPPVPTVPQSPFWTPRGGGGPRPRSSRTTPRPTPSYGGTRPRLPSRSDEPPSRSGKRTDEDDRPTLVPRRRKAPPRRRSTKSPWSDAEPHSESDEKGLPQYAGGSKGEPTGDAHGLRPDDAEQLVIAYRDELYAKAVLLRDWILNCDYESLLRYKDNAQKYAAESFEDKQRLMGASINQMLDLLALCEGKQPYDLHGETTLVNLVEEAGEALAKTTVNAVVQQYASSHPTDVATFGHNVTSLANSFAMFFVANGCVSLENICDDPDAREVYMRIMEIAQDVLINESVMCVGVHYGLQNEYAVQYKHLPQFYFDANATTNKKLLPMPRDMERVCVDLFHTFYAQLVRQTRDPQLAKERQVFATRLAEPFNEMYAVNVGENGKFKRSAQRWEQPVEFEASKELRMSSIDLSPNTELVVDLFAEIAAACTKRLDTSVDYNFLMSKKLCAVATTDLSVRSKGAPDSVMLCVFAETMRSAYGTEIGTYERDGQWQWAVDRASNVREWVQEGTCLFNFLCSVRFQLSLSNILKGLFVVAEKLALSRGVALKFAQFDEHALVTKLGYAWMADASKLRVARRVYKTQVDDSLFTLLCAVAAQSVSTSAVEFQYRDVLRIEESLLIPDAVYVQPQTWFLPSVYAFPATSAVKFAMGNAPVESMGAVALDMAVFKNLDSVGLLDVDIDHVKQIVNVLTRHLNTADVLNSATHFDFQLSGQRLLRLNSCREELRANLYRMQSQNILSLAQQEFTRSFREILGFRPSETSASVLLCALDLQTGGLVQRFVDSSHLSDNSDPEKDVQFTPQTSLLSNRQLMRPDNLTLVLHSLKDDPLLQMANTRIESVDAASHVHYTKWNSNMVGYTLRGTDESVHGDELLTWDQSRDMKDELQAMFDSFCADLIAACKSVGHDDVWWVNLYLDYGNSTSVLLNAFGIELQYLANHFVSFQIVSTVMGSKVELDSEAFGNAFDEFKTEDLKDPTGPEDEEKARLKEFVIDQMILQLLEFVGRKLPSANYITPYVQRLFLQTYNWTQQQEEIAEGNVRHAVFLYDTDVGFPSETALNGRETEMRFYADCVLEGRFSSFYDGTIKPYRAETAATMFNCGDMSPPLDDGFMSWQDSGIGGIVHMLVLFAGVSVDSLLMDDSGRRTKSWKEVRSVDEVSEEQFVKARNNIRSRAVCIALTTADRTAMEAANDKYNFESDQSVHDLMDWHETVATVLQQRRQTVQSVIDTELDNLEAKRRLVTDSMPYQYCVYTLYAYLLEEMRQCAVRTLTALHVSVNLLCKLEMKAIFGTTLNAAPFVPPLDVHCHVVSLEQWLQGEPRGEEQRTGAADLYKMLGEQGIEFKSHQKCANESGLLPTQHAAVTTDSYAVGATVELARLVQLQRYELCDDSIDYAQDWFLHMQMGPFALCQSVMQKAAELQRVRDDSQSRDIADVQNDGVWRASEFALAALAYRTGEYGSQLWKKPMLAEDYAEKLDGILAHRQELQKIIEAVPKEFDDEMTAGMQWYGDAVAFARAAALNVGSASTMAAPNRLLLCGVLAQYETFTPEFVSNLCHMGQRPVQSALEGQSLHNTPSSASCRASLRYRAAEEMMRNAETSSSVTERLIQEMSHKYTLDAQYQLDCQLTALRNEFARVKDDDDLRRAMALSNGVSPLNLLALGDDATLFNTMEAQLRARFERNCGLSRWKPEELDTSAVTIANADSASYGSVLQRAREAGADMFVASLWQPSCDIAKICSAGAELLHAKRDWWALRHPNRVAAKPRLKNQCVLELMQETYNDFNGEIPTGTLLDENEMKFKVGLALRGVFCGAGSQFVYESADRTLQNKFCTEIARVVSSNDAYSWHKLAKVDAVTNTLRRNMNAYRGDLLRQITETMIQNTIMDKGAVQSIRDNVKRHCDSTVDEARRLSNYDDSIAMTAVEPLFDCFHRDCRQMVDYVLQISPQRHQIQENVERCVTEVLDTLGEMSIAYTDWVRSATQSLAVNLHRVEKAIQSPGKAKLFQILPGLSSRSQRSLDEFVSENATVRDLVDKFAVQIGSLLEFLHECQAPERVTYASGRDDEQVCTQAAQRILSLVRVLYMRNANLSESAAFKSTRDDNSRRFALSRKSFYEDILAWDDAKSPAAIDTLLEVVASARRTTHENFAETYVFNVEERLADESVDDVRFTKQIVELIGCVEEDIAAGRQPKLKNTVTNAEFDMRGFGPLYKAIQDEIAAISDQALQAAYINSIIDGAIAGPRLWTIYVQDQLVIHTSNEMERYGDIFRDIDVEGVLQISVTDLWKSVAEAVPRPLRFSSVHRPSDPHTISCRDNARLMQLCGRMLERYSTVAACKEQLHEAMDRFSTAAVDSRGLVKATSVASDGALSRRARGVAQRVGGRAQRDNLEELSLHESTFAARSCTHQLSALCSHVDWGQRDGSDLFVYEPSVDAMLETDSDTLTLLQRNALTLVKGQARRAGQEDVYVVTVDCFDNVWFTPLNEFLARLQDIDETLLEDMPREAFLETTVGDDVLQALCTKLNIDAAELRLTLRVVNDGLYSPLLAKEMLLHAQLAKAPSVKLSGDDKWELTHVCDPHFYNQWVAVLGAGATRQDGSDEKSLLSLDPCGHMHFSSARRYASLSRLYAARAANGDGSANPRWDEERHVRAVLRRDANEVHRSVSVKVGGTSEVEVEDKRYLSPGVSEMCQAIEQRLGTLAADQVFDMHEFAMFPSSMYSNERVRVRSVDGKIQVQKGGSVNDFKPVRIADGADLHARTVQNVGELYAEYLSFGCDQDTPTYGDTCFALLHDHMAAFGRDSMVDLHYQKPTTAPSGVKKGAGTTLFATWMSHNMLSECYSAGCDHQLMIAAVYFARLSLNDPRSEHLYDCVNAKTTLIDWCNSLVNMATTELYALWAAAFAKVATSFLMTPLFADQSRYAQQVCISPELCILNPEWTMWLSLRTLQEASEADIQLRAVAQSVLATSTQQTRKHIISVLLGPEAAVKDKLGKLGIDRETEPSRAVSLLVVELVQRRDLRGEDPVINDLRDEVVQYTNFVLVTSMLTLSPQTLSSDLVSDVKTALLEVCEVRDSLFELTEQVATLKLGLTWDDILPEHSPDGWFVVTRFLCDSKYNSGYGPVNDEEARAVFETAVQECRDLRVTKLSENDLALLQVASKLGTEFGREYAFNAQEMANQYRLSILEYLLRGFREDPIAHVQKIFDLLRTGDMYGKEEYDEADEVAHAVMMTPIFATVADKDGFDSVARHMTDWAQTLFRIVRQALGNQIFRLNEDASDESLAAFREEYQEYVAVVQTTTKGLFAVVGKVLGQFQYTQKTQEILASLATFATRVKNTVGEVADAQVLFAEDIVGMLEADVMPPDTSLEDFRTAILRAVQTCSKNYDVLTLLDECSACGTSFERAVTQCTDAVCRQMKSASAQFVQKAYASGCDRIGTESPDAQRSDGYSVRAFQHRMRTVEYGVAKTLGVLQCRFLDGLEKFVGDTRAGRNALGESQQFSLDVSNEEETQRADYFANQLRGYFCMHMASATAVERRNPLWLFEKIQSLPSAEESLLEQFGWLRQKLDWGMDPEFVALKWHWCCIDTAWQTDQKYVDSRNPQTFVEGVHGEHDTQVGCRTPFEHERDVRNFLHPSNLQTSLSALDGVEVLPHSSSAAFSWIENGSVTTIEGMCLFALSNSQYLRQSVDQIDKDLRFLAVDTQCSILQFAGLNEAGGECPFPGMYGDCRHLLHQPRTAADRAIALLCRIQTYARSDADFVVARPTFTWQEIGEAMQATGKAQGLLKEMLAIVVKQLVENGGDVVSRAYAIDADESRMAEHLAQAGITMYDETANDLLAPRGDHTTRSLWVRLPRRLVVGKLPDKGVYVSRQCWGELIEAGSQTPYAFLNDSHTKRKLVSTYRPPDKTPQTPYFERGPERGRVQLKVYSCSAGADKTTVVERTLEDHFQQVPSVADVRMLRLCAEAMPETTFSKGKLHLSALKEIDLNSCNVSARMRQAMETDQGLESRFSMRERRSLIDVCPTIYGSTRLCTLQRIDEEIRPRNEEEVSEAMRAMHLGVQVMRTPISAQVDAAVRRRLDAIYTDKGYAFTRADDTENTLKESLHTYYGDSKLDSVTEAITAVTTGQAVYDTMGAYLAEDGYDATIQNKLGDVRAAAGPGPVTSGWVEQSVTTKVTRPSAEPGGQDEEVAAVDWYAQKKFHSMIVAAQQQQECALINWQRAVNADDARLNERRNSAFSFFYGRWVANVTRQPDVFDVVTASCVDSAASSIDKNLGSYLHCKDEEDATSKQEVTQLLATVGLYATIQDANVELSKFYADRFSTMHWQKAIVLAGCVESLTKFAGAVPHSDVILRFYAGLRAAATQFIDVMDVSKADIYRIVDDVNLVAQLQEVYAYAQLIVSAIHGIRRRCVTRFDVPEVHAGSITSVADTTLPETYLLRYMFEDIFVNLAPRFADPNVNMDDLLIAFAMQPPLFYEQMRAATTFKEFTETLQNFELTADAREESQLAALCITCCNAALGQRLYHLHASNDLRTPGAIDNVTMLHLAYELAYSSMSASRQSLWEYTLFDSAVANSAAITNEMCFNHSVARVCHSMWAHREIVGSVHEVDLQKQDFYREPYAAFDGVGDTARDYNGLVLASMQDSDPADYGNTLRRIVQRLRKHYLSTQALQKLMNGRFTMLLQHDVLGLHVLEQVGVPTRNFSYLRLLDVTELPEGGRHQMAPRVLSKLEQWVLYRDDWSDTDKYGFYPTRQVGLPFLDLDVVRRFVSQVQTSLPANHRKSYFAFPTRWEIPTLEELGLGAPDASVEQQYHSLAADLVSRNQHPRTGFIPMGWKQYWYALQVFTANDVQLCTPCKMPDTFVQPADVLPDCSKRTPENYEIVGRAIAGITAKYESESALYEYLAEHNVGTDYSIDDSHFIALLEDRAPLLAAKRSLVTFECTVERAREDDGESVLVWLQVPQATNALQSSLRRCDTKYVQATCFSQQRTELSSGTGARDTVVLAEDTWRNDPTWSAFQTITEQYSDRCYGLLFASAADVRDAYERSLSQSVLDYTLQDSIQTLVTRGLLVTFGGDFDCECGPSWVCATGTVDKKWHQLCLECPSLRFMSLEPVNVPMTVEDLVAHQTETRPSYDSAARRQSVLDCRSSLVVCDVTTVVPQLHGTLMAWVDKTTGSEKVLLPVRLGWTCRFTECLFLNQDQCVLPNTANAVSEQAFLIAQEMVAMGGEAESDADPVEEYLRDSLTSANSTTQLSKALAAPDVYPCDCVKLQRVYDAYEECKEVGDAYFDRHNMTDKTANMVANRYGMLDRPYESDVHFAFEALIFAILGPHVEAQRHHLFEDQIEVLVSALCPDYRSLLEWQQNEDDANTRTNLDLIAKHCGVSRLQLCLWWFARNTVRKALGSASGVLERLRPLTEEDENGIPSLVRSKQSTLERQQAQRQYLRLLSAQLAYYATHDDELITCNTNLAIGMAGVVALYRFVPQDQRNDAKVFYQIVRTYGHVLSCFNVRPQITATSTSTLSAAQRAQRDYFVAFFGSLFGADKNPHDDNADRLSRLGFSATDGGTQNELVQYALFLTQMQTIPGNTVAQRQLREAAKTIVPKLASEVELTAIGTMHNWLNEFLPEERQFVVGKDPEAELATRHEELSAVFTSGDRLELNTWAGKELTAEERQRLYEFSTTLGLLVGADEATAQVLRLETLWQAVQNDYRRNFVLQSSDFVDDRNRPVGAVAVTTDKASTMSLQTDGGNREHLGVLYEADQVGQATYRVRFSMSMDKAQLTNVYVTIRRSFSWLVCGNYQVTVDEQDSTVCQFELANVDVHREDTVYVSLNADTLRKTCMCRAVNAKYVVPRHKTCPIALNYILARTRDDANSDGFLYTAPRMWRPSVQALGFSNGLLYSSKDNFQLLTSVSPLRSCRHLAAATLGLKWGYVPFSTKDYIVPYTAEFTDDIVRMLSSDVWSGCMRKLNLDGTNHDAVFRKILLCLMLGDKNEESARQWRMLEESSQGAAFRQMCNDLFYAKVRAAFLYKNHRAKPGIERMRAAFVVHSVQHFVDSSTAEDFVRPIFMESVFAATMLDKAQVEAQVASFEDDDGSSLDPASGNDLYVALTETALLPLRECEHPAGANLTPYLESELTKFSILRLEAAVPSKHTALGPQLPSASVALQLNTGTNLNRFLQLFTEVLWYGYSSLREKAIVRNSRSTDAGCYLAAALAFDHVDSEDVHDLLRKFVRRNGFMVADGTEAESHVVRNMKLHVVATRPVIRHMMGSTIVMKRGDSTGRTLIGPENDFQIKQLPEPAGGQYYGNLTFYSKAFVQEQKNVHVKTGSFAVAYMNGNDTGPLCAVKSGTGNPLALAGDILTCVLPESYDKAYSLRGCNGLQEDIFGVWSEAMASVADCADAVDGSNGVHFACGPYNYMHLRGWQTMANRPSYLHMKTAHGAQYNDSIVHDWTDKRSSGFFGCERNTICYPGPHVALAIDALQRIDNELTRRLQELRRDHRDTIVTQYRRLTQMLFASIPKPERACHGSGHWKNSVGVGFAGGRSGRYDVLDRRNAHMPAYAYGSVEPGEYNTSGRPTIVAATPLAGVYGACTNPYRPSLGTVLNGATY